MGISMRLYLAPDSDLRAFTGAPRTLHLWLRYPRTPADAWLHESWRDLATLLAASPFAPANSPLTPAGGDWQYPSAADHGAHALTPASTQQLLQAIEQIDRRDVEAHVRQRWAALSAEHGLSPHLAADQLSAGTDELLGYLACLEDACTRARAKGFGLLMALWEL